MGRYNATGVVSIWEKTIVSSDERNYLTVKQIADDLGVSPQAIRNWISQGELEAIDLGHGYRIHKDEYRRFLESRKTGKKNIQRKSNA
jgi:excisionase family DNA binding protein